MAPKSILDFCSHFKKLEDHIWGPEQIICWYCLTIDPIFVNQVNLEDVVSKYLEERLKRWPWAAKKVPLKATSFSASFPSVLVHYTAETKPHHRIRVCEFCLGSLQVSSSVHVRITSSDFRWSVREGKKTHRHPHPCFSAPELVNETMFLFVQKRSISLMFLWFTAVCTFHCVSETFVSPEILKTQKSPSVQPNQDQNCQP